MTLARSEKPRARTRAAERARTRSLTHSDRSCPPQTFRVRVPRAHAETTRDAPDRDHRQMMRDGASFATLGSDDGDERVANASAADGEFEATPMEAACKMLFGEHEAPRMIQALSAARARERDARARSDAETPETQSRKGSMRDLRAVGPPIVRQSSCQSWDWRDDDGSPRESGDRRGPFARNEGESFKRVYSLCVLQHGEPPSLRSDEDDDGKTDRAAARCRAARFRERKNQTRRVREPKRSFRGRRGGRTSDRRVRDVSRLARRDAKRRQARQVARRGDAKPRRRREGGRDDNP